MFLLLAALSVMITLTMLFLVIYTPLLLTDKNDKSIGCEPDGERNSRGRDL